MDRRWSLLEAARPRLFGHFASAGVIRIEYTAAFPYSDSFGVWLCTRTDEERDALGWHNLRHEEARQALPDAGFDGSELAGMATIAQSQETVDRDYEGSWFYAHRFS